LADVSLTEGGDGFAAAARPEAAAAAAAAAGEPVGWAMAVGAGTRWSGWRRAGTEAVRRRRGRVSVGCASLTQQHCARPASPRPPRPAPPRPAPPRREIAPRDAAVANATVRHTPCGQICSTIHIRVRVTLGNCRPGPRTSQHTLACQSVTAADPVVELWLTLAVLCARCADSPYPRLHALSFHQSLQ
jgi:hypothetical protein